MKDSKRILVTGAAGGAGNLICREVMRQMGPDSVIVGDYRARRGKKFARSLGENVIARIVDVNDRESIRRALENVDGVVVANKQNEPLVQSLCVEYRVPCLDITAQPEFVGKVQELHTRALQNDVMLVVMAGLFPGLSGVMAKHASEMCRNTVCIHVGMLQSSSGAVGPTGIAAMLGSFARPVMVYENGRQVLKSGFTERQSFVFPEPFGKKTLRLFNYYESQVVAAKCNVQKVNYWTGFDRAALNSLIVILNKLGFLNLFNARRLGIRLAKIINSVKSKGPPESEDIAITVEVSDKKTGKPCNARVSVVGPSDYGMTAMVVVAMAKLILNEQVDAKGVCFPLEFLPLGLLLDTINSEDLKICEEFG